jgi:hypothetical protein
MCITKYTNENITSTQSVADHETIQQAIMKQDKVSKRSQNTILFEFVDCIYVPVIYYLAVAYFAVVLCLRLLMYVSLP